MLVTIRFKIGNKTSLRTPNQHRKIRPQRDKMSPHYQHAGCLFSHNFCPGIPKRCNTYKAQLHAYIQRKRRGWSMIQDPIIDQAPASIKKTQKYSFCGHKMFGQKCVGQRHKKKCLLKGHNTYLVIKITHRRHTHLHIPDDACAITRRGKDRILVNESTARQIAVVRRQLARRAHYRRLTELVY